MERERVLAEAKAALKAPVATITSLPAPHSDAGPHAFYSEFAPVPGEKTASPVPVPFREHSTALRRFSNTVATLTAAYLLTHEDPYALRAGQHLYAWFVQASTRMEPQFNNAGCAIGAKAAGTPGGVLDAVPLAEVARAMSFLVDTAALSPSDTQAVHKWLADLLGWLNNDRNAFIAREAKDRRASAWLLLASAVSRSVRDSSVLDACTHRFRKPTLRNQINATGAFPHEITTPFPFRNTLLNFDLLAGACQILSTPFDNLWPFELEDGPSMRAVAAFLFPALQDRAKWPYIADPQFFRDLPGRRAGLLFAGRAFNRPEYVDLWRSTPAPDMNSLPEPVAASFPIHEPLLWTTRAAHGL